jgi:hypothetical protein
MTCRKNSPQRRRPSPGAYSKASALSHPASRRFEAHGYIVEVPPFPYPAGI